MYYCQPIYILNAFHSHLPNELKVFGQVNQSIIRPNNGRCQVAIGLLVAILLLVSFANSLDSDNTPKTVWSDPEQLLTWMKNFL